ncbi:hypothetical protein ACTPEF_25330 [Clostridioides difficile]
MEVAKPLLKEKGYDLEVKIFGDKFGLILILWLLQ